MTRQIRKTTILIVVLSAFLAGLGAASVTRIIPASWVAVSILLIFVSLRQPAYVRLLCGLLLGFSLGLWRGSLVHAQVQAYQPLYGSRVVVKATAENDAVYADNGQLSFDVNDIELQAPYAQILIGGIRVEGFGEPAVYRGDRLQIEGKIYPTLGANQGRIQFAELKVTARDYSLVETLRKRFIAGMYSSLPEPMASFGLGLLIGQRNTLPDSLTDKLKIVGLTHIVAVSGYNLTILTRFAQNLFRKRSKFQTLVLSMGLIASFLLFTGFSASIVRAAIVAGLGLLVWYYGRTIRPLLLILLAAAITAGWNPLYLWTDIGWHLSFLAFFGVLIAAPLVSRRVFGQKNRPKAFTGLIIDSICAQILTAPLILFIFSEVSLMALPANALVVPLVPIAMLLSLMAGIGGLVIGAFAGLVSWPATWLLTYMLDIVEILSRVPGVLAEIKISLWQMLIMYGLIVSVTILLHYRAKPAGDGMLK